jgi:NAD(P)-dependent dehydrogenase (short-subunit alcohol dehydrogenase family)
MQGKTILITGGAHGLGAAYAQNLAEQKAHVLIADIDEVGAKDLAEKIRQRGGSASGLVIDVTCETSVVAAFEAVFREVGHIDVLVNNAGGQLRLAKAEDYTLDEWNGTLARSLTSAWLCSRAVIPKMKAAKAGKIINIASTTIDRGLPENMCAYISAKGGIVTLTRALARELGPFHITVNAVSPGLVLMNKGPEVRALADGVKNGQSLPWLAEPDEIVGAVAFLASDAARFITGQVINVDGGWGFR